MTQIPRKQPSKFASTIAVITLAVFTAVAFAALPLLALLIGMAIGQVLAWFTGDYVVHAFNALGLTGVGSDDLPKVFGLMAVTALFLKIGVGNALVKKRKGDD